MVGKYMFLIWEMVKSLTWLKDGYFTLINKDDKIAGLRPGEKLSRNF